MYSRLLTLVLTRWLTGTRKASVCKYSVGKAEKTRSRNQGILVYTISLFLSFFFIFFFSNQSQWQGF
ncbi:hypothetical protein BDV25DRAFT_148580 [Aspergillus avenaceus]|uniref:Uncharacterized protein n=1 Tax=Aspergillus avenaceus TaxID=36643 RepID=A0A5N6U5K4_ASPAV|nr:hypothetical protein BDV25DRAFT_148580 [Aspergillus avenaceus]